VIIAYGLRTAGRIRTSAGDLVSTVFLHLFLVPVVPLRSIIVSKKGYLLDEGQDASLNKLSVCVGYLRTLLVAGIGLGLVMAFDGMLLNNVVEGDKPTLVAAGLAIFAASSLVWLLAMFLIGTRGKDSVIPRPQKLKFLAGVIGGGVLVGLLFSARAFLPRGPSIEAIAADTSIPDEEAVSRLARMAFPERARTEVVRGPEGIEVQVSCLTGRDPSTRVFEGQDAGDAAAIHKASVVTPMVFSARKLIRHGSGRNLSKIGIVLGTTVMDVRGNATQVEVYRVSIPKAVFDRLTAAEVSRAFLFSADKLLEKLGVVVLDRFSEIDYQR